MGPSCPVERLSTELQALILRQAPTTDSLYCLIRASPRYYQTFLSMKEDILSRVVRRTFHPSVLPDALAVVTASQTMDRRPARTPLLAFLQRLERRDWEGDLSVRRLPLPTGTSIALCRLHHTINYFIDDYVTHTGTFFHQSSFSVSQPENPENSVNDQVTLEGKVPVFEAPLSDAETARLQRAFCRFELYGYLFYSDLFNDAVLSDLEQSDMFLANFPCWQIEEIACIRDYLVRRLCRIFDQVEDYFVEEKLQEGFDKEYLPFDLDANFFGKSNKTYHRSFMERMLLAGLKTLRHIFSATGADLNDLVVSEAEPGGHNNSLTHALAQRAKPVPERERLLEDWSNGVMLHFDRDDPDYPNALWLWASHYRPEMFYAESRKKGLRDWGYVFWDSPRLQAWGLLDKEPEELEQYKFDERKMRTQASAEERLLALETGNPESPAR